MASVLKQKKLNQPEPNRANPGSWQIVYTGFILILLCFFIMLTSFASLEESKILRFSEAFSTAVNVFEGGKSIEKGETIIDASAMMVDKENQMAQLFKKVSLQSRQAGLDQVHLRKSSRGVIMTLADKLLFTSGDARLASMAYPLLVKIAQIIRRIDVAIEIEGHSDDRPIKTNAYQSNWELSTARAVNVLRYLIEEQNVDAERLSAVGFSKYQPTVKNNSEKNRSINRRVEIIFRPNAQGTR